MCVALSDTVAPAITDPTVQVQLAMAISVLQTTAVRTANELAWMQEERDAIDAAAGQLLQAMPDATALAEALTTYVVARPAACISTSPRATMHGPARCCRARSRRHTHQTTLTTLRPSAA